MRRQRIRVRLGFGWVVSAAAGWGRAWGVWAGPGLVWMHSVVFACGCSLLVAGNLSSIAAQSVVVGDDDDAVGCCVGVRWRAVGCVGVLQTGPVAAVVLVTAD